MRAELANLRHSMLRWMKMGPRMGSEFWLGRANGSPGIGIIHSCGGDSAQPLPMIYQIKHGLINCKNTKPKMSSLLVLKRVYGLEIQSVMLVFSTGFLYYCPTNLLFG
jgi:hypothetical protein